MTDAEIEYGDDLIGHLPPLLQAIAESIDVKAAVLVANELGGRRIYIAPRPSARNPLVKLFGKERASAIAETVGSGDVEVPSARAVINWYLARQFRRAGWTTRQIARQLNLGERRVRMLTVGVKPDRSMPR